MKYLVITILMVFFLVACKQPEKKMADIHMQVNTEDQDEQCDIYIGWKDNIDAYLGVFNVLPWERDFLIERGSAVGLNFHNYCQAKVMAFIMVDGDVPKEGATTWAGYDEFRGVWVYLSPYSASR